jgi:hypothetical protein
MTPNIHPETGIRYGVISANSLDPDVVQELFYGAGANDLSYEAALKELRAEAEREADQIEDEFLENIQIEAAERGGFTDAEYERFSEHRLEEMWLMKGYDSHEDYVEAVVERRAEALVIEEPEIEGEYEGVKYRISWLGGAILVWITESPHTGLFDLCSPCVPGACDCDSPNPDGYLGYTVPETWLAREDVR